MSREQIRPALAHVHQAPVCRSDPEAIMAIEKEPLRIERTIDAWNRIRNLRIAGELSDPSQRGDQQCAVGCLSDPR